MHFYGWKKGLKTGMCTSSLLRPILYPFSLHILPSFILDYLRTRPAAQAIQFTLSAEAIKEAKEASQRPVVPVSTPTKPVVAPVASLTNGVSRLAFVPNKSSPIKPMSPPIAPSKPVSVAAPAQAAVGSTEEKEVSFEEAKRLAAERAEGSFFFMNLFPFKHKADCALFF